jgi:serine/threonine-protein kinase
MAKKRKTKKSPPKSAPEGPALFAGDIIGGKWTLLNPLGRGGMGEVWKAENAQTGEPAAIKVSLTKDAQSKREFLVESLVGGAVSKRAHKVQPDGPGSPQVYASGTTKEGFPYVSMELLDGEPLDQWSRRRFKDGKVRPERVAQIMDHTLQVLESAHDVGVTHRDIKPENIFITNEGKLKVLDFGLSKSPLGGAYEGYSVGTRGYAPPEQTFGLSDERSDVWGVGATGLELLTGNTTPLPTSKEEMGREFLQTHYPFVASHAKLLKHISPAQFDFRDFPGCPVPPVETLVPGIPKRLAEVLDNALECDLKDRYSSIKDMRKDLRLAMEQELLLK